ncbi:MAG: hypothetical protein ACRD2B_05895 [Terriglobia bacterium]
MRLRHRPSTPNDFRACLEISTVRGRYGSVFQRLPEIWAALLYEDSLLSAVVENLDGGAHSPCLAFGVSVFLRDEFVRQAKVPPLFWIGPELVRRAFTKDTPILDLDEIRAANSGDGLNLFVWEVDVRPVNSTDFLPVTTELTKAFFEYHAGFNIKEVIGQHPFGRVLNAAVQVGGWLAHHRSGNYSSVGDPREIERQGSPFILGLTRELAHRSPGSWLTTLFDYRPPRLFLTAAEQRLLKSALEEERTDAEISKLLTLSISTIKKCWQSVYSKASFWMPDLLPDDSYGPTSQGIRGAEKRRRLLLYLRNNPQELRPRLANRATVPTGAQSPHRDSRADPVAS